MRFRYSTDFRCGIAVFADFVCVVLWFWVPPNAPLLSSHQARRTKRAYHQKLKKAERKRLYCEEACFKFHARNYYSNLLTKELPVLQILDRNLREVCTTPWCIYQPAVRRLVGKPPLR